MMVYRETAREATREELFAEVAGAGDALERLVSFGELESAALDAMWGARDGVDGWTRRFRRAALAAGDLFVSAQEDTCDGAAAADRFAAELERLARAPLPGRLRVSVPEGYAYYGLYPETYAAAARRFFAEARPQQAVIIGIRSIGTSLSAVVAAALGRLGCAVRTYTVRPGGHPFDRRLEASAELEREWREGSGEWFAIVDEGPGLSGSSFACVARRISELGVPDERIVLFPSWNPAPERLLSAAARDRWGRHRKYTVSFETAVLPRLAGARTARDLSAGRWREWLCGAGRCPASQPQHERRKYLLVEDGGARLMKFEGLGRYGRRRLRRAERLATAGFCPRPESLAHGFLTSRFVAGRAATPGEAGRALLDTAAAYLAHLRRHFATGAEADAGALLEMVRVNLTEGAGRQPPAWLRRPPPRAPAVEIDGRMLPHEWIAAGGTYVKTDALDHHDDHFLPGCHDVAWDLAGACIEFDLPRECRHYLIDRYRERSDDTEISGRLPFYIGSYLAYRWGYCSLAASALAGEPDGARFARLAARYAGQLREELRQRA